MAITIGKIANALIRLADETAKADNKVNAGKVLDDLATLSQARIAFRPNKDRQGTIRGIVRTLAAKATAAPQAIPLLNYALQSAAESIEVVQSDKGDLATARHGDVNVSYAIEENALDFIPEKLLPEMGAFEERANDDETEN